MTNSGSVSGLTDVVRAWMHRGSSWLYGPTLTTSALSWIGDERVAVTHRREAVLVPAYRASVEAWLAGADVVDGRHKGRRDPI
jgi:hypothetical protein